MVDHLAGAEPPMRVGAYRDTVLPGDLREAHGRLSDSPEFEMCVIISDIALPRHDSVPRLDAVIVAERMRYSGPYAVKVRYVADSDNLMARGDRT